MRATALLAGAVALAGAVVGPTPATSAPAAFSVATAAAPAGWHPVLPAPTVETTTVAASGPRCTDAAGTWLGMRWRDQLRWRINNTTIPAYLGDHGAVVDSVRNAAVNVDRGRNDCGLAEGIALRQVYTGLTTREAGVTSDGGCTRRDGHNVVSFGQLRPGLLAVTCIWWFGDESTAGTGGHSVESDILIDNAGGMFFLNPPAGCSTQWDLESTVTHEFGHAFGLGHVPYAEHGSLTMSDGLPDCTTAYRGLGLGDYMTLKNQYG